MDYDQLMCASLFPHPLLIQYSGHVMCVKESVGGGRIRWREISTNPAMFSVAVFYACWRIKRGQPSGFPGRFISFFPTTLKKAAISSSGDLFVDILLYLTFKYGYSLADAEERFLLVERRLRDVVVRALRSAEMMSFVSGLETLLEAFAQVY